MTVKFYLKRPSNPRESVIYAQFSHNRVCYKYYLMEKVHPVNWDFRAQRVKINTKRTGTLEINQRLENVSWKIIESFYLYQNKHCGHCPPPHSFRIILDEVFNKRSSIKNKEDFQRTFWGFFQNLLLRMESGSRLHTQKILHWLERQSVICEIFSIIYVHLKRYIGGPLISILLI